MRDVLTTEHNLFEEVDEKFLKTWTGLTKDQIEEVASEAEIAPDRVKEWKTMLFSNVTFAQGGSLYGVTLFSAAGLIPTVQNNLLNKFYESHNFYSQKVLCAAFYMCYNEVEKCCHSAR